MSVIDVSPVNINPWFTLGILVVGLIMLWFIVVFSDKKTTKVYDD